MTDAEYMDYDDLMLTRCLSCPWSTTEGYYIWCPNCGSSEVKYDDGT